MRPAVGTPRRSGGGDNLPARLGTACCAWPKRYGRLTIRGTSRQDGDPAPACSLPLPARFRTATLGTAATAVAAATEAAAALGLGPRFVYRETAAAELVRVQLVD